jgi:hypothetical protein
MRYHSIVRSSHSGHFGRALAWCALFSMTMPLMLTGQAPPQLAPGSLVRVQTTVNGSPHSMRGTLVSAASDSVLLVSSGRTDTLTLATGSLTRVEISTERRSRAAHGALLGAAIGSSIGLAIVVAAAAEDCSNGCFVGADEGTMAGAALILGGLGACLGGAIGSASHTEHWVKVPVPLTIGVTRRMNPSVAITIPLGPAGIGGGNHVAAPIGR